MCVCVCERERERESVTDDRDEDWEMKGPLVDSSPSTCKMLQIAYAGTKPTCKWIYSWRKASYCVWPVNRSDLGRYGWYQISDSFTQRDTISVPFTRGSWREVPIPEPTLPTGSRPVYSDPSLARKILLYWEFSPVSFEPKRAFTWSMAIRFQTEQSIHDTNINRGL